MIKSGKTPRVTILMPVYNAAAYVREAVESILAQTFKNFELLAINDGSTDATAHILRTFDDKRVRVLDNNENLGIIQTMNLGLDAARSEYVARMDGDDICHHNRLELQVRFLDTNPGVDICGGSISVFGKGKRPSILKHPTDDNYIRCAFLSHNPMANPTVMFRREPVLATGERYLSDFEWVEDYDFFERLSNTLRFGNLPDVLLDYRIHDTQVTQQKASAMRDGAARVRRRQLLRLMPQLTTAQQQLHEKAIDMDQAITKDELHHIEHWLLHLSTCMGEHGGYDAQAISKFVAQRWINICNRAKPCRTTWMRYRASMLRDAKAFGKWNEWKLSIKCLIGSLE